MLLTWPRLWQSPKSASLTKWSFLPFPASPLALNNSWEERAESRSLVCLRWEVPLLLLMILRSVFHPGSVWWQLFWDSWWCEWCLGGGRGRVESAFNWGGFFCEKSPWGEHRRVWAHWSVPKATRQCPKGHQSWPALAGSCIHLCQHLGKERSLLFFFFYSEKAKLNPGFLFLWVTVISWL